MSKEKTAKIINKAPCKRLYERVLDVKDFRYIGDHHLLLGQENGTDDLKRLVLATLRPYGAAKLMASFYNE